MRHHRLILFLLMLVTISSISAQRLLPWSVKQFLGERTFAPAGQSWMASLGQSSRYVSPRMCNGREMVDAFIAVEGEASISALRSLGVEVNCLFDGFVTAQVPVDRLTEVSMLPGVTDVEISRNLQLCTDSTMSVCHVNEVLSGLAYNLPASYDGSGVIVALIDYGFDYQHLAFRSSKQTESTRIVRVYDTQSTAGRPVQNENIGHLPGSVFMDRDIYNLTTDNATATHGTHTASIAAGTHVRGYGGMAPGANIVLCAVSVLDGSLSAVEVANCVRYIDAYADSVGMPCVMSMSVSTPSGQHDGKDYLSMAINQVTGPGRIFVISAGNNAGRNSYAHKMASADDPLNLLLQYKNNLGGDSTYYYGPMSAEIWMRTPAVNNYFKVHVLDRSIGKIVWESPQLASKSYIYASELAGYYDAYNVADTMAYIKLEPTFVSYGRKYRLSVSVRNLICHQYVNSGGFKSSRYALGLSIYPRRDAPCEIDAWTGNINSGFGTFKKPVIGTDGVTRYSFYSSSRDSCCIGSYACGDSTISVGAFAARNSYYSLFQNKMVIDNTITVGDIASYSSYQALGVGPTGRAMPDICAPGVNVVAAGSRYSYFAQGSTSTVMKVNGNYWGVMSGTSMAAPTVAGIIALWLQAYPQLSVADVREVLAKTGRHDSFTTKIQFGPNGKIDALKGMLYVLDRFVTPPPPPIIPGDVNGNGDIDIRDVTAYIDYILGRPAEYFVKEAADVNGDGYTDISDLTALINIVLGVTPTHD